jgi:hypothetical protein
MEARYVRTGDATCLNMAKFWGKLFLINFALGVVTGITMEFQFGMNWAEYTALFLLLGALIIRGVSYEFRSKEEWPRWRSIWDTAIMAGNFFPALLFGVAFGNTLPGYQLTLSAFMVRC